MPKIKVDGEPMPKTKSERIKKYKDLEKFCE
jgi:hypothetical protein